MSLTYRPTLALAVIVNLMIGIACQFGWAVSSASADEVRESADIINQLQGGRSRGIVVEADGAIPAPRRVDLPAIQFEFNSDRLTRTALSQTDELVTALNSPSLRPFTFAIQGHTDSIGSDEFNRSLSLRRAQAVKEYLANMGGISRVRLVEVGLGENYPIRGITSTDERNRRVEIVNLGSYESPISGNPEEGNFDARRRALIIGIEKYRHVSRLEGPVNDALQMASFLTEHTGFQENDIRLLLDEDATRTNILASVKNWLIAETTSGDEVFLFFSGHGFYQPDTNGDEDDQRDETLVPVDVSVDNRTINGMITDDEISVLMKQLSGRQVQVIIDACHSGTSTRGTIGDWRYVKTPRLPDGTPLQVARTRGVGGVSGVTNESFLASGNSDMIIWTAVRAEQKALIDQEADHDRGSVFTRRFLWGVRDKKADLNRDGNVTVKELYGYVYEESQAYCERHSDVCGLGLSPQLQVSENQLDGLAFAITTAPLSNAPAHIPRSSALAKDIFVETKMQSHTNERSAVRLNIDPGVKLVLGDKLDILVESDHDGDLVVFDINATGDLVQIFPNARSLSSGVSNRIEVGKVIRLPGDKAGFRFRATAPVGRGLLVAIVSDNNSALQRFTSLHKDLSVVPRPQAYLLEIAETLRNSAFGWHTKTLEYEIVLPQ